MNKNLLLKMKEALLAVLPISATVLVLHFTIAPLPAQTLKLFLLGAVMLIFGMGLFTLGADMSMMTMGERIGAKLSANKKLLPIIVIPLIMGIIITIAEPDLQVLAEQVPSVPNMTLILSVAVGVGVLLVISLLRIVFQIRLSWLLIIFYAIVFVLALFTPGDFLPVAFDSGGVTTGPITVPFILSLGIGISAVRGGKTSYEDSFGLVGLSSIGPIIAVMILGLIYSASAGESVHTVAGTGILQILGEGLLRFLREVGIALLPIVLFFILFQIFSLKLPRRQMIKMGVGVVYTYVGLVIFLTGVNIGFMPAGNALGGEIASLPYRWILIPIGMVMGLFVVAAEPAVHVLNKQVEEISGGAISQRMMMIGLSGGIAVSVGLAMLRILTGWNIGYFLLPGYAIALILTFFVPRIFTAVAFDSGGVASGPMTATFLLPFAMGACAALGGNILQDAFGIVAMVAMTPLVTIQLLGLVSTIKNKRRKDEIGAEEEEDIEIIDLEGDSYV